MRLFDDRPSYAPTPRKVFGGVVHLPNIVTSSERYESDGLALCGASPEEEWQIDTWEASCSTCLARARAKVQLFNAAHVGAVARWLDADEVRWAQLVESIAR